MGGAEKEPGKIAAKSERYARQGKSVPKSVQKGFDERFNRVEQIAHRVVMLQGAFAVYGVLPLEMRSVASVADLIVQYLDALEEAADNKGSVQQVLDNHFAIVYKVSANLARLLDVRAA